MTLTEFVNECAVGGGKSSAAGSVDLLICWPVRTPALAENGDSRDTLQNYTRRSLVLILNNTINVILQVNNDYPHGSAIRRLSQP